MKAMLAGFAAIVVVAVAAWFVLNDGFDYTEEQRASDAVRLD
jgi:hypothetical protein